MQWRKKLNLIPTCGEMSQSKVMISLSYVNVPPHNSPPELDHSLELLTRRSLGEGGCCGE